MRGYKAIKDFTYNECVEFLKRNPSSPNAQSVRERLDWLKVQDDRLFSAVRTISDVESYLNQCSVFGLPGIHRNEAKQMVDTLYFEQNQSTKKGLKRYLNRYPEGLHAQDAENLLRLRKWNRNVVFIILLVCSLLIAIMFYDMIRRGSSQESESSGYEVPEFGEAVDSAEVDSSLMNSVRTDTIVAPAPVEVEDNAYTDSISLDYGCEFAGKVEDSNGIPREIYGVLTVCDISEVSGFYYYKSSAKKVGVEDSKIFFKGRAWAGADGEGSYEISMSALFRDGTPPEHWEGMLYIGNDESAFNGRIRDHNGVRYTVSFIGDNYY